MIQKLAPQVVEVAPQVIFDVARVVPAGFARCFHRLPLRGRGGGRLGLGSGGRDGRFSHGRRRRFVRKERETRGHDRREGQTGGDRRARASGR